MTKTIRNVNKRIFAELKAEAAREGLSVGEALNLAILSWLERRKSKKLNFMEMKTESWGKGTEKTSKEIDKILYGD